MPIYRSDIYIYFCTKESSEVIWLKWARLVPNKILVTGCTGRQWDLWFINTLANEGTEFAFYYRCLLL